MTAPGSDGTADRSTALPPVPRSAELPAASVTPSGHAVQGPVQPDPVRPAVPMPVAAPVEAPVQPGTPPGPAAQLGAAFVSLPDGKDGTPQTLVIRLDPRELGRVQIKLERSANGPARIELAAERPDTLMLLMQDRSGLDGALTQAGIPLDGRTLTFSLGDAGTGGNRSNDQPGDQSGNQSGSQLGNGTGQRAPDGSRDGGWDQPRQQRRRADAWTRAGVDITA